MSCPSLCPLVSKTSIDPSLYSHVDSALKRLKLVSRRLSAVLTIWREESRVLDRLYYKGKNQHRTSLFWRHVEEIRRFCLRVNSLDLVGTLNRLRHSFYDSVNYDNPNILKGCWTHIPQARDLRMVIRTCTPICQLLLKACQRFRGAYCSFKWAMQTGAFLQLILTLSAISCRLHNLAQVIQETQAEAAGTLTDLCISVELAPSLSTTMDKSTTTAFRKPSFPVLVSTTSPAKSLRNQLIPEHDKNMTRPVDESGKQQQKFELEPKRPSIGMKDTTDKVLLRPDKLPAIRRSKEKKELIDDIDRIFGF